MTENKYTMVAAIVDQGHGEEVMNAARSEGARGGTVVKAKGTASGSDMFFGMAISDEKEIIYIVARKEEKSDIMKAIASYTNEHGTHPITFSLPVTETAGFRLLD